MRNLYAKLGVHSQCELIARVHVEARVPIDGEFGPSGA